MTGTRRVLALALALLLAGCASMPIPPTYTPEELAQKCTREGGVWKPNIAGGYCEFESQGFL